MGALLGFPVMILGVILQMTIVSRLQMLQGCADLILLILAAWSIQENVKSAWPWMLIGGACVAYVSAQPFFIPFVVYAVVTWFARLLHARIWQAPILAMLVTVALGTLVQHGLTILGLQIVSGIPLAWGESLQLVALPSGLLNLILAVPVYLLIRDLAESVYPVEVQP